MTKSGTIHGERLAEFRCAWCRRPMSNAAGPGRPRRFCKRSCRQRDFEARRIAAAHGLDETALIVARSELDELRDLLAVLEYAIVDVERDLEQSATLKDYQDALNWLLAAARPLAESPGPAAHRP